MSYFKLPFPSGSVWQPCSVTAHDQSLVHWWSAESSNFTVTTGRTWIGLGEVLQTWFFPFQNPECWIYKSTMGGRVNHDEAEIRKKRSSVSIFLPDSCVLFFFHTPSLFIIYYLPFWVFSTLKKSFWVQVFHWTWCSFIWLGWLSNQFSSCLDLLSAG